MRRSISTPVSPGNLVPVVSLDEMLDRVDPDGGRVSFDLIDPSPQPDECAERREIVAALVALWHTLSERDREVFRRVLLEDETQTAVAADMQVSKMAISKAVARIQKKARAALAPRPSLVLDTERGIAAIRVPAAETQGLLYGGENRCRKIKEY